MHTPITKRAWIAIATAICVTAAVGGWYIRQTAGPIQRAFGGTSLPRILGGTSLADIIAGPPPDILSELPAGSPVVGYMDAAALRKLKDSPLAAMLGLASAGPREDREYQNFVRDSGFDYTRDLDKVAIAFWPSSLTPTPGAAEANRIVAIAEGRFDKQKINSYALRTGKIVTRGTSSFYEVPSDIPGRPPIALEFLSATRIALASGKDSENLLTNLSSTAHDAAMQGRIKRVAAAPIFAVARTDHLPNSMYSGLQSSPQFQQMARSIQGLTLAGQPAGENLILVLEGECDSTRNALELSTLLDGFRFIGSMALKDPKTTSQMTKEQAAFLTTLLGQIRVIHQDRSVRLVLELMPSMLSSSKLSSSNSER